jgi:2-iminobutanoate/2-iminopropanoate deaminase
MRHLLLVGVLATTLLGCATSDAKVREIVRAELGAAWSRAAVVDGNVIGPYSPAQRVGDLLFVSGQVGIDPATGGLVTTDIEAETRQVLDNLMRVVKQAGFAPTDITATTVYLKDIADFARMNAVYATYFSAGSYPARSTVQVAALPKDARIEISAIAARSPSGGKP